MGSQPASHEALVKGLQAVRRSEVPGFGPGRPCAAVSCPPAPRENLVAAIQETVQPALDCRVPMRRAPPAVANRQFRKAQIPASRGASLLVVIGALENPRAPRGLWPVREKPILLCFYGARLCS